MALKWKGLINHKRKLSNLNSTACHLGQVHNEFQAQNNRIELIRFTHNSILMIGLHYVQSSLDQTQITLCLKFIINLFQFTITSVIRMSLFVKRYAIYYLCVHLPIKTSWIGTYVVHHGPFSNTQFTWEWLLKIIKSQL